NPALGHEYEPEYNITPSVTVKRVMVVGAGPSGMEAAITAAQRGHKVTVYEKSDQIGGALRGYAANDLAHPEDLQQIVSYYEVMAEKHGVEVKFGVEPTPKMMRGMLHEFDAVILATGAMVDMDSLPISEGAPVVDAFDVAKGKVEIEKGQSVAVVGGGKIGLTLAESLKERGYDVVIIDENRRLGHDVAPTWKWRHTSWIKELGIETITGVKLLDISAAGVKVLEDEEERFIEADTIIAAGPIRPNQALFQDFQWMVDETHGTGDCMVPGDLTTAIHSGFRLGCRV
ncbi:MAG: FAD-dependent oxidoreductase, partial [Rhodospirillaceae bacterium]|nr:FAD-dependent oxidoreductase [Rhodospirillaceae bacterium]